MAGPKTELQRRPPNTAALTRQVLDSDAYAKRLDEMLGEEAPYFKSSVIALAGSWQLQGCDPQQLVAVAMKSAVFRLSIDPTLGHACIVAYDTGKGADRHKVAQFQIMAKGIIQLAMRSGAYRHMNATAVNAQAFGGISPKTGEPIIFWDKIDEDQPPIGYACAWELLTGFQKTVYWTTEKCMAHGKRYSQAFQSDIRDRKQGSLWSTNPPVMCLKTVVKNALSKWGLLSIEMRKALSEDTAAEAKEDDAIDTAVLVSEEQRVALATLKEDVDLPDDAYEAVLKQFGVALTADLPADQYDAVAEAIRQAGKPTQDATTQPPAAPGATGKDSGEGITPEAKKAVLRPNPPQDTPEQQRLRSRLTDLFDAVVDQRTGTEAGRILSQAVGTKSVSLVPPDKLQAAYDALDKVYVR